MKRYWRPYFTGSEDFSKVFHFDWIGNMLRQLMSSANVNPKSSVHMAFNPFNLLSHDHVAANWWHGTQLEDTRGLAHVEPRPHAALWALFLACSGQGFSILRTGRARPEVGGLKTWPASAKQGTAERCLQSRAPPEIRWFPAFVRQWLRSAYVRQSWDRTWSKGHHRTWVQKFSLDLRRGAVGYHFAFDLVWHQAERGMSSTRSLNC